MRAARTREISNRTSASNQERLMQQMEPHRRRKMIRFPVRRSLLHAQSRVRGARNRRHQIKPRCRRRPHDLRLRSRHIRAEAEAFVALAVGRGTQRRHGVAFVVAAITGGDLGRGFRRLAFQTMARSMAAPAGYGLRQHENCHQLGNEYLHKTPRVSPIITVIGCRVNAACGKAS
jgi:hypothetical protein